MLEELLPGFYKIEVPLPNTPLRALNAYFVAGDSRNLLIDNGFNHPECAAALNMALDTLNVDLANTDFFLTHSHSDHNGLTASLLRSSSSKIMCSKDDGEHINAAILHDDYWQDMLDVLLSHGFPRNELDELCSRHPGRTYSPPVALDITAVRDGDQLNYGMYSFTVIETPGHTPGHLTLYEPANRIFISGDHILDSISPNITHWPGIKDSLGDYLKSLDKISMVEIDRTFPAHRGLINDTSTRIAELKNHHKKRLDEAYTVLEQYGPLSAYDTASHMKWALKGATWEQFKVSQKCFATGEAISHLVHLQTLDRVKSGMAGGITLFYPV